MCSNTSTIKLIIDICVLLFNSLSLYLTLSWSAKNPFFFFFYMWKRKQLEFYSYLIKVLFLLLNTLVNMHSNFKEIWEGNWKHLGLSALSVLLPKIGSDVQISELTMETFLSSVFSMLYVVLKFQETSELFT